MNNIAIILPAYNEELTISSTIETFHQHLPNAAIWIINNCSTDNTVIYAKNTLDKLGCVGGIITENRPGKGNAVRRAFLEIHADIYVLVDADLTYPAEEIEQLLAPIHKGHADMVVGDRHSGNHYAIENKRIFHGFGNRLVRKLVNKIFGAQLVDIMSGYRAFNRCFVKNYPILIEGFELEVDMTLHALDKRFRIVEIPISYRDRPTGSVSKLHTFSDGAKVLFTIFNIFRHYKPLIFFGISAGLFAFSGLIIGMPVVTEWLETGYIYHVPSAILATGLEVISVILGAIGLILNAITMQNKQDFERALLASDY